MNARQAEALIEEGVQEQGKEEEAGGSKIKHTEESYQDSIAEEIVDADEVKSETSQKLPYQKRINTKK